MGLEVSRPPWIVAIPLVMRFSNSFPNSPVSNAEYSSRISLAMSWQEAAFHGAAFIAGLFLLEFGAERFIEHTAIVARRLGISPALIALLTAGAEWEELVVVVAASLQQRPTLALGNVVGSSISNILGAFSLGLLFHHPGPIVFDRSSKIYTTLQLLLSTVVVILAHFKALTSAVGGVLVAIFVVYIVSIGYGIYKGVVAPPEMSDSDSDTEEDNSDDDAEDGNHNVTSSLLGSGVPQRKPHRSILYHAAQLFLGFLALSISGYILSHSAAVLANFFHLSGTVMGFTILSFATTLPEKFVAVMGGARGEREIVVANTAGSNIFLLSLCLGVTLLSFGGDSLNASISQFEIITLWVSSVLFYVVIVFGSNRWFGLILLVMYIAFIALEFTVFKH